MSFCLLLVLMAFIGASIQDSITPTSPAVHAKDKEKVSISCKYQYSVSMNNLQWYRQYLNSAPEFLILIMESGQTQNATPPHPRLTASVDKGNKMVNLEIFPADVKDSAMYYCALQNTGSLGKIIYGQGTKLFIHAKEKKKADVYKLQDSCLATDFTNHEDVKFEASVISATPVRYSGEKYQNYYSSFAWNAGNNCTESGGCKDGSSGSSDMEIDEKINFVSLGLFWLRILLLKTVVFNILMTFKAWMS